MSSNKIFLQIPFKHFCGKPSQWVLKIRMPEPYNKFTFLYPAQWCEIPASRELIELIIDPKYVFRLQNRKSGEVIEEEKWSAEDLVYAFDNYSPFISNDFSEE